MSQDQKPSRVRLVSSGAIGAPVADPTPTTAGPAEAAPAQKRGLSPIVLAILFILGCALGGAALPLLHLL